MNLGLLIPLAVIGSGIALVVGTATAAAKKKSVSKSQQILTDEEVEAEDTPPEAPPGRAIPKNPINQSTFSQWWKQTEFGEAGVPGIWTHADEPTSGLEWLGGWKFSPNPNVAIATNDGALWYWDNGWHPAPKLATDYDDWYSKQ